MRKEVKVDSRGHVSLTGVRTKDHVWYLAEEDPDGTIHLVPAMLVPAVLRQPEDEEHEQHQRLRDSMEILRDYFPEAEEIT